jgi:hypothetical protein
MIRRCRHLKSVNGMLSIDQQTNGSCTLEISCLLSLMTAGLQIPKTVALSFFLFTALGLLSSNSPVRSDGVCNESGWCRMHFSHGPYPFYIYPLDTYGRFRRFWVRAGGNREYNQYDCVARMYSLNGGPFRFPTTPVANEMFDSICLKQNIFVRSGQSMWQQPAFPPEPPFNF